MAGLGHDIKFALRTLRKSKAFTAVAVLALAVGIGGTTVMYSAVDGVLLKPLPYPESDQMVQMWSLWGNGGTGSISYPDFADLKAQSKRTELMTAVSGQDYTLVHGQSPAQRVVGQRVSPDFFKLLGVQPAIGRVFSSEGFEKGGEVLLGNDLWTKEFGANPDIIGQPIRLTDKTFTIIGVLPAGFQLPRSPSGVYVPLVPSEYTSRGSHFLQVFARLAPGQTLQTATAELVTVAKALESSFPDSNKDRSIQLRSWSEYLTSGLRPLILLLFGAVVLVLIIACANVANMLMARAASRQSELALRFALGATRGRVIRQILTECLVLALGGAIVGIGLAFWGIDACRAILPKNFVLDMHLDLRALLFAGAIAVVSVLLFGLIPALRASQEDVAGTMKEGARTVARKSKLRSVLVVVQVALSFALLVGAALLGKSFNALLGSDVGFQPEGVLTARVTLPAAGDSGPFFDRLLERVRAIPQVTTAGLVDFLPLTQNNINGGFEIEGKVIDDPNRHTEYMIATPGYFETMKIAVVHGRPITGADGKETERVCVVNQEMARKYFGEDDPVGKRIKLGWSDDDKWMRVVGVVRDVRRWTVDGPAMPETYMPFAQYPYNAMAIVVRGKGPTGELEQAIRREVSAVDSTQAAFDFATMSATVDDSVRPRRLLLEFTGVFSGLALALAAIGLYGVLAVMVAQRTHELGIRMALGARPSDVRRLVVQNGVLLTVAGVAVGVLGALLLSSLFAKLLYGVAPTDVPTYLSVSGALIAVAFVAAWIPARRATKIDPMIAMRHT